MKGRPHANKGTLPAGSDALSEILTSGGDGRDIVIADDAIASITRLIIASARMDCVASFYRDRSRGCLVCAIRSGDARKVVELLGTSGDRVVLDILADQLEVLFSRGMAEK